MLRPAYMHGSRKLSIGGVSQRQRRATRNWFFIHYLVHPPQSGRAIENGATREYLSTPEIASDAAKLRRLEAALFVAQEELSSRKLAKLVGLADATEARTLIRQLNNQFDREGCAYRVEEVAGGYAMMTRSQFAPWLRRLTHVPGTIRLSQSAIETLAVVAYRQPVLRANVEAIRGVGCSEVLKQLMELDLVRISGRSEELGRPYLYGTTRRFLQMFGLRSADRLPRIEWVNEPQLSLSSQELADPDSETKESTVKLLNASVMAAGVSSRRQKEEDGAVQNELDVQAGLRAAVEDDDEYFDDDEVVDDEDEFDDEEDDVDEEEEEDGLVDDEEADWEEDEDEDDVDEEDVDDELDDEDEDESDWEEVDDEDDEDEEDWEDDDEDDEDDDWEEDEEDDEEDWD